LSTDTPVQRELNVLDDGKTIQWANAGGGPGINQVVFELSQNLITWTELGKAKRSTEGWEMKRRDLPLKELFYLRAKGIYSSGSTNGSGSVIAATRQVYITSRDIYWPMYLPAITGNAVP